MGLGGPGLLHKSARTHTHTHTHTRSKHLHTYLSSFFFPTGLWKLDFHIVSIFTVKYNPWESAKSISLELNELGLSENLFEVKVVCG